MSFNVDLYGSLCVHRCGKCKGDGLYLSGTLGFELYIQAGYAKRPTTPHKLPKGNKNRKGGRSRRNERMTDPWTGKPIKRKKLKPGRPPGSYRERDGHIDFASEFDDCPKGYPHGPVQGTLYAFIRASAGVGWFGGVQYSYNFTWNMSDEFSIRDILESSSGTGSVSRRIYGISVEIGGGRSATGKILLKDSTE